MVYRYTNTRVNTIDILLIHRYTKILMVFKTNQTEMRGISKAVVPQWYPKNTSGTTLLKLLQLPRFYGIVKIWNPNHLLY